MSRPPKRVQHSGLRSFKRRTENFTGLIYLKKDSTQVSDSTQASAFEKRTAHRYQLSKKGQHTVAKFIVPEWGI